MARNSRGNDVLPHATQSPMFEKNTQRQSRFSNETMTMPSHLSD